MQFVEQYSQEHSTLWQKRIIKTCFNSAIVITIFELAYFFILSAMELRDQAPLHYVLQFIILPACIIFSACFIGSAVQKSKIDEDKKSLACLLAMLAICCTAASIHNIFAATLCGFFIPLAISAVFGHKWITRVLGVCCIGAELIAMLFASQDLRGQDPYFLLDCLMFFIVFSIFWYVTLLLMRNEQEKRAVIDNMCQEQHLLQEGICHDELTGLYNLLGLQLYVDGTSEQSKSGHANSSLAFLDIDDFKLVNDNFGHEVGNHVLIHMAHSFLPHFPEDSCIARYGGDEFVVLLPGVPPSLCKTFVDHLLHNLENSPILALHGGTVSLSCGIAQYDFKTPILEAINVSDQAMYRAKATGKNRSVVG